MESAERLYEEALRLHRLGNLSAAISKLEESLTVNPKYPDALEALGVLYSKAERLDEAVEIMKRLIQAVPHHIMARTNLSRFYVRKGMILEAEREQGEARRLSWKLELQTQKRTGQDREPTADEASRERETELRGRIERYRKVIELDREDVLGYFSLGTALMDAGRFEEARTVLEQGLTKDPNHSPSYFNLGVVLESLILKEEAVRVYERGIQAADKRGDMIPLKKMQARLGALKGSGL